MKKLILTIICTNLIWNSYSQSLVKVGIIEPEANFRYKISELLRVHLNYKKVPNCYSKIFFVKFVLNENSKIQNIQFSVNMTDTLIQNIVSKVIKEDENIWDIKKVKNANPTMSFLIPINMAIFKDECQIQYGRKEIFESVVDFTAMLKYYPIEKNQLECLTCISKEKFVGMVLNPLVVNNGDPSH